MKKFALILSSVLLASGFFAACDSVEEDERYIPIEKQEAKRVVLVEEFTGMSCTNCPDGHQAIHNLLEAYPESVIPVCIHSGDAGLILDPTQRLKLDIPAGQEYYRNAGSPALPAAVINMQTPPLQVPNWASSVVEIMAKDTPLTLSATANFTADKKSIDIDVDMSSVDPLNGKLLVWVCENNIVGYQLDHGKHVLDYVHNHVLRAVVNDTWGESVSLTANNPTTISYSQPMQEDWVTENTYIVAFVYNDTGVVQAAQCEIK